MRCGIPLTTVRGKEWEYLFIVLLSLFALSPFRLSSQTPDVRATLAPALDPRYDHMSFDLILRRLTPRWEYFANTTLRIQSVDLAPTGGFNPAIHTVTFEPDSSDLNLVNYNAPSMSGYHVDFALVNGDIVVNIVGPDSVDVAHAMSPADTIRLGRFVVSSNDNSYVPEILAYATPTDYYQACAFKIDHDSVTGTGSNRNVWFAKHDNPPLAIEFDEQAPPPDICDAKFNFYGEYIGDLEVRLGFSVSDEHCYEGFIIERALVNPLDAGQLTFGGRPQLTYLNEPRLLSCLCLAPQTHEFFFDDVEYRREVYAYRLIGKRLPFYGDSNEVIDTIFIRIPNAIVSNARLLENPFKDQTTVRFNVDDRLRLTASVYDLGGRHISYLLNSEGVEIRDVLYTIGIDYRIVFRAPDLASQGLYNIVLVATPVDDTSIEAMSRVILKAQLLR